MKNSIIILNLLFSQFIHGQENETNSRDLENFFHWAIEISVESADGDDDFTVMFGVDPDATDGFDEIISSQIRK